MTLKNPAVNRGYHSVTPYLIVRGAAEALEFYKNAFDAVEVTRFPMEDGKIGHAEIRIGDSPVMLADEVPEHDILSPQSLGGSATTLLVYVEDVDAVFAKALAAGAAVWREVKDQFYGDRSGCIRDPFGHGWTISTPKEQVSEEEQQRRFEEMQKQGETG